MLSATPRLAKAQNSSTRGRERRPATTSTAQASTGEANLLARVAALRNSPYSSNPPSKRKRVSDSEEEDDEDNSSDAQLARRLQEQESSVAASSMDAAAACTFKAAASIFNAAASFMNAPYSNGLIRRPPQKVQKILNSPEQQLLPANEVPTQLGYQDPKKAKLDNTEASSATPEQVSHNSSRVGENDQRLNAHPQRYNSIPGVVQFPFENWTILTPKTVGLVSRRTIRENGDVKLEKLYEKGDISLRVETPSEARQNDEMQAQKILRATEAILKIGEPLLCYHCNDLTCWAGCTTSNAFHDVALALKHSKLRIPSESYWHNADVRIMLGAWSFRMYNSYDRSLHCQEDMDMLARLLLNDVKRVAKGDAGRLDQILGNANIQSGSKEINRHQLAMSLGGLERDFYLLAVGEQNSWVEPRAVSEPPSEHSVLIYDAKRHTPKSRFSFDHDDWKYFNAERKGQVYQGIKYPKSSDTSPNVSLRNRKRSPTPASQPKQRGPAGPSKTATKSAARPNTVRDDQPKTKVSPTGVIQPAGPKGKSPTRSQDAKGKGKTVLPVALEQTIVGNAAPARSSQLVLRSYEELSQQPIPSWAVAYEAGKLSELGLKVKNFDIEVQQPAGKHTVPRGCRKKDGKVVGIPSWPWMLYAILSRVPGNWMKTVAISRMAMEWRCEGITEKGIETGRNTGKSNLTKKDDFYMERDKDGGSDNWWRLADLGETYEKGPGGRKLKKPRQSKPWWYPEPTSS